MENLTRRSFVSSAAAGMTALGFFSGMSKPAEAQLIWNASDWKLAEFQKLVHNPARIKQVWDIVQIGDGKFLSNIKNAATNKPAVRNIFYNSVQKESASKDPNDHDSLFQDTTIEALQARDVQFMS